MQLTIGTRGSKLAIAQTRWVIGELKKRYPEIDYRIQIILTKSDHLREELDEKGGKESFIRTIEEQLQEGKIDLAVHNMKDVPSKCLEGLMCAMVPKREDRSDALVLKKGIDHIMKLPVGATIGTCSKRRAYQLLMIRPDLKIIGLRGNIDSCLRKMEENHLDGIILATSELRRLGLESLISYYIPEELMIPAPAQGALGLQIRKQDVLLRELVKSLASPQDELEVRAERGFLAGMGDGRKETIGATAHLKEDVLALKVICEGIDEKAMIKKTLVRPCKTRREATQMGIDLAKMVIEAMND